MTELDQETIEDELRHAGYTVAPMTHWNPDTCYSGWGWATKSGAWVRQGRLPSGEFRVPSREDAVRDAYADLEQRDRHAEHFRSFVAEVAALEQTYLDGEIDNVGSLRYRLQKMLVGLEEKLQ